MGVPGKMLNRTLLHRSGVRRLFVETFYASTTCQTFQKKKKKNNVGLSRNCLGTDLEKTHIQLKMRD